MGYKAGSIEANKGKFGEKLVDDILKKELIDYQKPRWVGAHNMDFKGRDNDGRIVFGDVKTQEPMRSKNYLYYTGFKNTDAEKYNKWLKKVPNSVCRIYYVDYFEGCVYYMNLLDVWNNKRFVNGSRGNRWAFPLCKMKVVRLLTFEEIHILKNYTSKNYKEPSKRFFEPTQIEMF